MGVYGLWRLIEASGKQVPIDTLEGKILAVDISIWIHQMIQGYQGRQGSLAPNAHLLGLYRRICKLLYYKIKPVFVFDGSTPLLKKNTIASRKKQKSIAADKAQKMKNELISNLIKHTAVGDLLNKDKIIDKSSDSINLKLNNPVKNDIFQLPPMPSTSKDEYQEIYDSDSESSDNVSPRKQNKFIGNIHDVNITTEEFQLLPADVRFDILTDLKETRKQNSWGRIHELPRDAKEFSNYQLNRLLKRRRVQEALESAEKEMGGKTLTLDELDKLLTEQGVNTNRDTAYRIASDSSTRLFYINDINAAKEAACDNNSISKKEELFDKINNASSSNSNVPEVSGSDTDLVTDENNKTSLVDDINEYGLDSDWDSDLEFIPEEKPVEKRYFGKRIRKNPALTYMMEYTDLTESEILKVLEKQEKENQKEELKTKKIGHKRKNKNFSSTKRKKVLQESTSDSSSDFEEVKEPSKSEGNVEHKKSNESSNGKKQIVAGMSDSSSDDFVEVPDVPVILAMDLPKKDVGKKESLEITVDINQKLKDEDDIFADIFEKEIPNRSVDSVQDSDSGENISGSQESKDLQNLPKRFVEFTKHLSKIVTTIPEKEEIQEVVGKTTNDNRLKKESLDISLKSNECESSLSSSMRYENKEDDSRDETTSDYQTLKQSPNVSQRSSGDESILNSSAQLERKEDDSGNLSCEDLSRPTGTLEGSPRLDPMVFPTDDEELVSLKSQLEAEEKELRGNIGKFERQATDVTDQMRLEAQELLRLWGIPYVDAPTEAEAQCAYLETIKLTHGTITDDSDIWLFGGQCVYKNFFDKDKQVLQFQLSDIQHHFNLSRRRMIQLALLTGSDYTTGVAGVGPVTALEILAAFPSKEDDLLESLLKFATWIKADKLAAPSRSRLRNKLRNIQIGEGFPSPAVVQAYLSPTIDESKETFTWGKPNLVLLADYTRKKFGWTKDKFDEIMTPVMKRQDERKTQRNIDSYFQVKTVPKSIEFKVSGRVQGAIKKLGEQQGGATENLDNQETQEVTKKKKMGIRKKNVQSKK